MKISVSYVIIFLLIVCCGGASNGSQESGQTSTKQKLGKLPSIAKQYKEDIAAKNKQLEETTDREEFSKLYQEVKLLGKEADKIIEDYVKNNPITNLPFEQKADYQFTINNVDVENASDSRINFKAKVIITEDIRNNFGNPPGFANTFFAYVIAVDKEGNSLTRKHGVFGPYGRGPFKADMEVEIHGSLDGPADLENFDKLVFISKEDLGQK